VTNCGDVGAGQVTKILNNMVLFETVNALAEAVALARRSDVDPALLLDTLSKGSADSFALRNHGLKAIVPGKFSGARVLDRICAEGPVLRAGAGGGCRNQNSWRRTDRQGPAGSDRRRLGGAHFPVIAKHIDRA
jgi:3-hydroxyisobutyrate dehydrogenase